MHISKLPPLPDSEALTCAARMPPLAEAMGKAIAPHTRVVWQDRVLDGPQSIRVFFVEQVDDGIPLDQGRQQPMAIAAELMRFTEEARYPEPVEGRTKRGWKIHRVESYGVLAIIATAAWCEETPAIA